MTVPSTLKPSALVAAAHIIASDGPGEVVRKLDAAFDAAVSPPSDLDADMALTIDQRDTAEGWADGLAALIGKYFGRDIGEHSSAHCPWQEAKEIIAEAEPYHPAAVARSTRRHVGYWLHHPEISPKGYLLQSVAGLTKDAQALGWDYEMVFANAPALEGLAVHATPAQVQALHRARSALHAIAKTYDDSELRTRALEAEEEMDRLLAAAPQAPVAHVEPAEPVTPPVINVKAMKEAFDCATAEGKSFNDALRAAACATIWRRAKRPDGAPDAVGAALASIATECALHAEERHSYLPDTPTQAATWRPHDWVLQAMSRAISFDHMMNQAAPAAPSDLSVPQVHPLETVPKDGTIVRLLVQFADHPIGNENVLNAAGPLEDTAGPCWTIGGNTVENTGVDHWQFVGWNWQQDCFEDASTDAGHRVLGWAPFDVAAPAAPSAMDWPVARDVLQRWAQFADQATRMQPRDMRNNMETLAEELTKFSAMAPVAAPAAPAADAETVKKAARYDFLHSRDLSTIEFGGVFAGRTPDNVVLNGQDLDAAIDASIATANQPAK